jgi:hypothetical protein
MLVIFSGCDKVGKTTMAKKVANSLGGCYVKFSGPKTMDTSKIDVDCWVRDSVIFHESILRYLESTSVYSEMVPVILDRFYPDEVVYSKVMRNRDIWSLYEDMDERFAKLGTIFVLVRPASFEFMKSVWKEEKLVDFQKANEIVNEFDRFYEMTQLKKIQVDMNTDHLKVCEFVWKV